jgi:carbonic anhydrase
MSTLMLDHLKANNRAWAERKVAAVRQVKNVASDVFVQDAWARGQSLGVHRWVYSLADGLVTDLDVTVSRPEDIERLS